MKVEPKSAGRAPWSDDLFVTSLILCCFLVYTWRFDYAYGTGDQDELLPTALSLLDGSLFTRDWLVQTVREGVNVRSAFVWLLAAPGTLMPLEWSTALLHSAVWMATAAGVYALALEIIGERLGAAIATFLATCVTVFFAIGSNAIVTNALLPEGVAWALILPGILFFLRRRWAVAGVLVGAAAWFHLLAGGLSVAVLIGAALLSGRGSRDSLLNTIRFGAVALIVSLPILIPVALDQASGAVRPDLPDPMTIHAIFRNPWHHLFFSFSPGLQLRFWSLMGVGIGAFVWLRRRDEIEHGRMIAAIWIVSACLWIVAILFVEIWPVALIAKLQLFKTAVLASLLATIMISAVAGSAIPGGFRGWLAQHLGPLSLTAAITAIVIFTWLISAGHGAYVEPLHHPASELGQVETWARENTATDALFVIPPLASSFRSFSRRAVVADWNGFVFGDAAMQEWYERLTAVARVEPHPRGADPRRAIEAAYAANDDDDFAVLRERYGVDYVVTAKAEADDPFPIVFQAGRWTVRALSTRAIQHAASR